MISSIASIKALEAVYRGEQRAPTPVGSATSPAVQSDTASSLRAVTDDVKLRKDQVVNPTEQGDNSANPRKIAHSDSVEDEVALTNSEGKKGEGEKAAASEEEQISIPKELTAKEEAIVREMRRRDAEVRRHEQGHSAIGGAYAGSPSYEYETGPDGKRYVVSGEVRIDSSPENDPRATIEKMTIVIRAALTPADPSVQDRRVAAQARANMIEAQRQLAQEKNEEANNSSSITSLATEDLKQRFSDKISGTTTARENREVGDLMTQLLGNYTLNASVLGPLSGPLASRIGLTA